ncbi:MAG: T9SS type A sorting domain-containing protein [Bacteroidia bacterium]
MKSSGLLLILGLSVVQGLWAQNPLTHSTHFSYNFATETYSLNSENSYAYNELDQLVFQRYASWQAERSYPNLVYETSYTYHPDGAVLTRSSQNYRLDTLEGSYWSKLDQRGNLIQDSSHYRDQEGESMFNANRYTYTYDSQDRLIELETESKSTESPSWVSSNFRLYRYNQNGCLTEIANGSTRAEPTYRRRNEYDQDCRLTATYEERREGFGNWDATERTFYTDEQFDDSTVKITRIEYWRDDLNRWSINNFNRQVFDTKGQLIRFYNEWEGGRAGESIYRYSEAGEEIYAREGFREFISAQWTYWHEAILLENTSTRQVSLRRNDWDTINQEYRHITLWEQITDEQDRLLEQNFIDSLWDGSGYEINDRQTTYQYEEYCDGLVKTQFQREGASGLSPQPTVKVEFGYLKAANCLALDDELSLQIHPNPASHLLMLTADLLLDPQTSICLIDLAGRIIKSYPNPGRQSRLALDIRDLEVGIYIIQLNHPERQLSQQIIKQ